MKIHKPILTILVTAALAASTQAQTLLYNNGPVNGTLRGLTVDLGIKVTDSFTLATDSTVASGTVGIWSYSGDSLSSVQWSITTAPFGGTTVASGTSTTTDSFLFQTDIYSIYSDSFSITPTELSAGTYWFQLGDASTGEGKGTGWDVNSGPSSAYQNNVSVQSEAFQLYGTVTNAPEPSTVALVLVGGLSLVGLRRRK